MITLIDIINNLNDNEQNNFLCCKGKETTYGVEVSYKDNENFLLSRDNELRIMVNFYNGEETASDYINNERCIHFTFNELKNFKEFIHELLLNNFKIEYVTKGKDVIWRGFSNL